MVQFLVRVALSIGAAFCAAVLVGGIIAAIGAAVGVVEAPLDQLIGYLWIFGAIVAIVLLVASYARKDRTKLKSGSGILVRVLLAVWVAFLATFVVGGVVTTAVYLIWGEPSEEFLTIFPLAFWFVAATLLFFATGQKNYKTKLFGRRTAGSLGKMAAEQTRSSAIDAHVKF